MCKILSLFLEERGCAKDSMSPSTQLGPTASIRASVSSPALWPGSHAGGAGQGKLNAQTALGKYWCWKQMSSRGQVLPTGRVWA